MISGRLPYLDIDARPSIPELNLDEANMRDTSTTQIRDGMMSRTRAHRSVLPDSDSDPYVSILPSVRRRSGVNWR